MPPGIGFRIDAHMIRDEIHDVPNMRSRSAGHAQSVRNLLPSPGPDLERCDHKCHSHADCPGALSEEGRNSNPLCPDQLNTAQSAAAYRFKAETLGGIADDKAYSPASWRRCGRWARTVWISAVVIGGLMRTPPRVPLMMTTPGRAEFDERRRARQVDDRRNGILAIGFVFARHQHIPRSNRGG